MTFSVWLQQYLRLYKRDLAEKTIESYTRLQGLMDPILGSCALAAITPDLIQAALIHVQDQAGSRQAQLAYALVHAALVRAVKSRHIPWNPCDDVDKPHHEQQPGRAITPAHWQLLAPLIDEDVALALMGRAGLRRGVVLALRWGDVDLSARQIKVARQLVRVGGQLKEQPPKSAAGVRCVPIEEPLAAVLRRAFVLSPALRVVRCSPETLARRWTRLQLEAGIPQPYRLHDLRHTYATRLVAAGYNLRILQYTIGHSSMELTAQTYTHITPEHAVNELDRISAALH